MVDGLSQAKSLAISWNCLKGKFMLYRNNPEEQIRIVQQATVKMVSEDENWQWLYNLADLYKIELKIDGELDSIDSIIETLTSIVFEYAISHRFEELETDIVDNFPATLFECQTLKTLKLGQTTKCLRDLSGFATLTTLQLSSVIIDLENDIYDTTQEFETDNSLKQEYVQRMILMGKEVCHVKSLTLFVHLSKETGEEQLLFALPMVQDFEVHLLAYIIPEMASKNCSILSSVQNDNLSTTEGRGIIWSFELMMK
ncbi:hypothetical protein EZV62_020887 [Acer yangbiense]|uniref:Uncharacterized protein n=1 Tax=Acer yangbiense TaxID=1000413 RepID=A0A5C7HFB0_9ROSI|nr:hypothetical protein EZV62_020887 [Acer yangbiense]